MFRKPAKILHRPAPVQGPAVGNHYSKLTFQNLWIICKILD